MIEIFTEFPELVIALLILIGAISISVSWQNSLMDKLKTIEQTVVNIRDTTAAIQDTVLKISKDNKNWRDNAKIEFTEIKEKIDKHSHKPSIMIVNLSQEVAEQPFNLY